MLKENYKYDKEQVDTYQSLDSFIENLIQRKAALGCQGWIELGVDLQTYGYDYDPTDYKGLFITGQRPMTVKEVQDRDVEKERNDKIRINNELKQFEELKKKYGENKS